MKYLLDTHTWIWWKIRPQNLSKKVTSLIEDTDNIDELLLSVISIWELCKLLDKGKVGIAYPFEEWIIGALDIPKFRLIELTPIIAYRSTVLTQLFHNDPADQIIVAGAIEENATLLTKDKMILSYPHVKTIW